MTPTRIDINAKRYYGKPRSAWSNRRGERQLGTERDSQRRRLYLAESFLDAGKERMEWDAVLTYVAKVTGSAWWRRSFAFHNPSVNRKARGGWCYGASGKGIWLTKAGCRRSTILHELAHFACPGWSSHGRLFARVYLDIVSRFLGKDAGSKLACSFRKHGVKFKARPDLSDEERERRRARMTKFRGRPCAPPVAIVESIITTEETIKS